MLRVKDPGMKYIEEYRDKGLILRLIDHIKNAAKGNYTFMEVCGGHTSAIHRFGIPSLLPQNIRLISGPGCPVCVTGTEFIDKAIAYSIMDSVIIATFGDLMRVPGSASSLERERSEGADIRVVFSGLEALSIAKENPDRKVIFLGIGFETTAPGTAVTVKQAKESDSKNFLLLSTHKIMPPAMESIIRDGIRLNGFICPGHVAAITGSEYFNFITAKYDLGCVISGFEPTDILMSVLMLVHQVNNNLPATEIQYTRAVTREGNKIALRNLYDVFEKLDTNWRGLGIIPGSGLKLRNEFEKIDAEITIPVSIGEQRDNPACICGDILRGVRNPPDCSLFNVACFPENPVGACMVSDEGACNSFYKYPMNE